MFIKKTRFILCAGMIALTACTSQIINDGKQDFDQGKYQSAMEKLMPLAQKDNPVAEYAVGYMYYYGKGVAIDKTLGLQWINKAAAQGYPDALAAQQAIKKQAALNPLNEN